MSGTSKDVALATIRSLSIAAQQGLCFPNEALQAHPATLDTVPEPHGMTLAAVSSGEMPLILADSLAG